MNVKKTLQLIYYVYDTINKIKIQEKKDAQKYFLIDENCPLGRILVCDRSFQIFYFNRTVPVNQREGSRCVIEYTNDH
jgi:hypothetical protein